METRQLEYFVAVAEELSFTRAAQRLFATQSTVSATIRALETDLGTTLFDRSTRRVALSTAGALFLPEAKAALESVERAREVVQQASAGLRGSLRIGTLTSMNAFDLPVLLGAFHRRHPLVDLHLTVSLTGSSGLADDVRHGRLDVALLGLDRSELGGLDATQLASVPYYAVLPESHPLAQRDSVTLPELDGEHFVDCPRGFGNRLAVDREFASLRLSRRVIAEIADLRTVPRYVAAGLGVAVLPGTARLVTPGAVAIPVADTSLIWPLTVVVSAKRPPSQALRTLLELFVAAAAEEDITEF